MRRQKINIDELSAPAATKQQLRNFIIDVEINGAIEERKVKAISRAEARDLVRDRGAVIRAVTEKRSWTSVTIGKPVPEAVLLQVTRQLAAFSSAGIPLLEALTLLGESTKHPRMREVLLDIRADIRAGQSLAEAAASHKGVFPGYYLAILEASDRTGDVVATFETIASYLERDLSSRRAIKSAMYYPAVLIVMALVAGGVLSVVVLPRFSVMFASLDTELPLATRMLMNLTGFIALWWYVIAGLILMALFSFLSVRATKPGRLLVDAMFLRLPIFGNLLRQIELERFMRVLNSLTNAGVPLSEGLELSAQVMGNSVFARAVRRTRAGVIAGEGLAKPLGDSRAFPEDAVQIVRVGEQSGSLVQQLDHAGRYYGREVDYRLKTLTALVEPVVLLVVGGGVGFVAVALVSAMYGIYSSASFGA